MNSRGRGTLALCAPKGFELGFERRPISAVFCLFRAHFGVKRLTQSFAFSSAKAIWSQEKFSADASRTKSTSLLNWAAL